MTANTESTVEQQAYLSKYIARMPETFRKQHKKALDKKRVKHKQSQQGNGAKCNGLKGQYGKKCTEKA